MNPVTTTRRQFFRGAAGAGTLAGLGLNLKPARAAAAKLKIQGAREVPSICPYCAVGCAQIVSVTRRPDRQHRGEPGQPDQPRHALPQGLGHVPARGQSRTGSRRSSTGPRTRPTGKRKTSTGRWTGSPSLVKETRDRDFRETWDGQDRDGKPVTKRVNHCTTIASLGGATMDNEWNYAHLKLWRALGLIWLENQARI